ncbi:Short-chain dehydrogenase/reductase SDR [Janthinobacterium sp. CG23_2]|nr:Short-chain dehydrogenase/reductase SDR [Janthinobacterium sp. CG23_2]CUU26720.1 Short-chain dehydrogenase/reductase SDR [Janthinobacterium sp. CG23_2]
MWLYVPAGRADPGKFGRRLRMSARGEPVGRVHRVRIFIRLMLECAKDDPAYEGHLVSTASMAGLLNADHRRVQGVQACGGVSVGSRVSRLAAGGGADRGVGAVSIFCSDRHQPVAPQPAEDVKMTGGRG